MASTFSLQGKLGLDARDFKKGAGEAEKAIGDVADELEELPDTAKKSGGDAGSSLGGSLMKGFAAIGVGAAIGKALNDAMDVEAGVDRVQAQFGLTADEAERYGKLGGDLYASAWGSSASEATASIAKVGTQLQEVGGIAETELSAITGQVYAVSDVFGQDFDAVVRSVGNLLKNGLAVDAEEALDLVTVAFQGGNDRAGDLLDTIDEYSPYWAALGIEGDEALGMIQLGFQNGFRDADKLADLIKEFGIRVLTEEAVEAFDALGLHGEQMRAQFGQGGDAARDAMDVVVDALDDVEDPIERNRLGVQLFGTQWEDIGPQVLTVLQNIETGLGDVEGASSEMAETVGDNTATAMEELKRRVERAMADTAASILPVIEAADQVGEGDYSGAISGLKDFALEYNIIRLTAETTFGVVKDVLSDTAETTGHLGDVTGDTADEIKAAKDRTDWWRGSLGTAETAVDDAALAVEGLGDDASDTADDLSDITYEFDKMKGSMSERSAFLNVQDGFDGIKAKALEALAAAGDQSDEAKAKLRDYEQAQISLKGEVIDYAEKVMGIPPEVVSEINALIDQGQFDEAQRRMDELERDRTATISVSVRAIDVSNGKIVPVGSVGYRAEGGPVKAGSGYVVGEEGPEFFIPDRSGFIVPAAQTAAMMSVSAAPTFANASGGNVYNVTVHSLDAERAGQVIVNALTTFSQAGGQVPAYG